jgi:large conductance mechanosensitive channel
MEKTMKLSFRQMLGEFKEFAFKGNMIDLAVGVVLGAAFGGVIKSMVDNIIMPIVSYVPGLSHGYESWAIGRIRIGHVLADLLNFSLVALAVFLVIVKLLGAVMRATAKPAAPAAPVMKECPRCISMISIKATKCPHCTADLESSLLLSQ